MKLRFLRGWHQYKPGQIIDAERGFADIMVRRKLCELVVVDVPTGFVAMVPESVGAHLKLKRK